MSLTSVQLARLLDLLAPYRNEPLSRPVLDLALRIAKEVRV